MPSPVTVVPSHIFLAFTQLVISVVGLDEVPAVVVPEMLNLCTVPSMYSTLVSDSGRLSMAVGIPNGDIVPEPPAVRIESAIAENTDGNVASGVVAVSETPHASRIF